jgi:hypothetical protein
MICSFGNRVPAAVTGAPVLTTRRRGADPRHGHVDALLKTERVFAVALSALSSFRDTLLDLQSIVIKVI